MCLAAFAISSSSAWPLVIAANRDEFFNRPASTLARWQTPTGNTVISGRDLRAGGTWLGVSPQGRIALVTNVREGLAADSVALASRGDLALNWLEHSCDTKAFAAARSASGYGGVNLVLGDLQRGAWNFLSNRGGAAPGQWVSQAMPPGIYGLSNAALDTPWPKTTALKSALQRALHLNPTATELETALWTALQNPDTACAQDLPQTGVPEELEQLLSSAFISDEARGYGTRCSTLISLNSQTDTLTVSERTYAVPGSPEHSAADSPAVETIAASTWKARGLTVA